MKRIFTEIGAVALFVLLYLLFPTFRTTILSVFVVLAIWVVPVQLILSINYRNWLSEMSGRYSHLSYDERLRQIRNTFEGLKEAETIKLRWFYIHVHVFHYLLFTVFSLTITALVIMFTYLGLNKSNPLDVALHLAASIFIGFGGYIITSLIYPIKERKERDEIFNLFLSRDWRRKIEKSSDSEVNAISQPMSFYDFWMEGKTIEQKEQAFKRFLENLNKGSRNGQLFRITDQGKVELVMIIDARALNKTIAGFLKFCIEDRKVLSDRILKYSHRSFVRDVFMLGETQSLTFLETERVKNTPVEYSEVYKSAYENAARINVNSAV
ncbi:hypothetical protein [Solitalea lacus]|uniref:hypothetical protein n=1 Tax=Solitalea lacus TaxID=2911172 RepID=UPI001EDB5A4D|nr:hypothetical protein [Solitalea lacus]UKJ07372.1 hypothetical protein L2B55_17845 [Solitalea lacus]